LGITCRIGRTFFGLGRAVTYTRSAIRRKLAKIKLAVVIRFSAGIRLTAARRRTSIRIAAALAIWGGFAESTYLFTGIRWFFRFLFWPVVIGVKVGRIIVRTSVEIIIGIVFCLGKVVHLVGNLESRDIGEAADDEHIAEGEEKKIRTGLKKQSFFGFAPEKLFRLKEISFLEGKLGHEIFLRLTLL